MAKVTTIKAIAKAASEVGVLALKTGAVIGVEAAALTATTISILVGVGAVSNKILKD